MNHEHYGMHGTAGWMDGGMWMWTVIVVLAIGVGLVVIGRRFRK